MDTNQIMADTKRMIDDLKTVCGNFGLGNAPSEYKIITEVFLYKYLNDKFLHEIRLADDKWKNSANLEEELSKLSEDEYDDLLDELPASTAVLQREHLISYLFNHKNQKKSDGVKSFSELFDDTLVEISNLNIQIFSVHAGGEDVIKLFDAISQYVIESNKRDDFCRAIIDKLVNFSFENAFMQKYDFFAAVFEYLIKDYNKDFGKYAEYYTPHSIASIIARIMVPEKVQNVTVYDPAAGSGTLVLALAHEIGEDNCTIYTQDITQKSNEFLRLNLILNSLVHSLGNVVHGDTLLSPQHVNKSGLMKFDYIVSNPPFNVDFSDNRDTLAGDTYKERFWAGVPAIPKKDLDSMDIYLLFIQHIVFSMKPNGRAAIVVPTGFLTKKNKIEKTIKEHIIEKKMLKAVISMPSNIFATTGTNVSIIFLDSSQEIEKPILVDATGYGEKIKIDGKNQKTVLAEHEIEEIVDILSNRRIIEGISVFADIADIKRRNYSFSAGSFFEAKIEYEDITVEQFNEKLSGYMTELEELMHESEKSHQELLVALGSVRYDL
ncbi:MAG: type I restriction-modification system subunit M [Lachnobacterium sp.]|nr:type I restriction-modification system subunit M [Lachnobacterium sp.]